MARKTPTETNAAAQRRLTEAMLSLGHSIDKQGTGPKRLAGKQHGRQTKREHEIRLEPALRHRTFDDLFHRPKGGQWKLGVDATNGRSNRRRYGYGLLGCLDGE